MSLRNRLGPAPKAPNSFDRSVAIDRTLSYEPLLRTAFGITRVAEITHLDRIGIPVFSAIVPDSPEAISVYNGKGLTAKAARAGAVMEAVERQSAARMPVMPRMFGVRGRLRADDLLDPERRVTIAEMEAILGPRRKRIVSSNGLASGNTLAEAVYHALMELIERHVWSVVHAIAHRRPNAIFSRFIGRAVNVPGLIDDAVAMELQSPSGSTIVDCLVAQVAAAGLHMVVRAVHLRPFPHLFIATIVENGRGISRSHSGFGCSLAPEHAAIRAITEAAQGRAADMQAAREDFLAFDDPPSTRYGEYQRRRDSLPTGRWFFDAPARPVSLSALPDASTADVASDIERLLAMLLETGVDAALIVDLSSPNLPVSVVRAIVPGLERTLVDGSIGPTIASILNVELNPPILAALAH